MPEIPTNPNRESMFQRLAKSSIFAGALMLAALSGTSSAHAEKRSKEPSEAAIKKALVNKANNDAPDTQLVRTCKKPLQCISLDVDLGAMYQEAIQATREGKRITKLDITLPGTLMPPENISLFSSARIDRLEKDTDIYVDAMVGRWVQKDLKMPGVLVDVHIESALR